MFESRPAKRTACVLDLDTLLTPVSSPIKRSRQNSYDSPVSVQSMSSSEDDVSVSSSNPPRPAKRRGRPPKTEVVPLSPSFYPDMPEADYKYMEMRVRNNEASRRSRLSRKDKETQISRESSRLEANYRDLVKEEESLMIQCNRWRRAVMRLATL